MDQASQNQNQNQQQQSVAESYGSTVPDNPLANQQQAAAQNYYNLPQQQQNQHDQELQSFWANQMHETEQTTDFKTHSLPLARIKRIMKAEEDVRMISAEAPIVLAKACEMFILELTLRSWIHTEENKRRTVQKSDIATAISRTDVFDFLVDVININELKEESDLGESEPFYYVADHH
ncbi:nuclear transcription factor Y subunit C-2-like [Impatiens glandulifera]|uniref:nuclear transcription factor Y subunit C-2-like n=1 Tax=Impatiens glandulifera TaxID=253017 RepID=UPI001FB05EFF|nr:nuclear transcription factor Y subunit C-2-like [Impatiens glandulifera]